MTPAIGVRRFRLLALAFALAVGCISGCATTSCPPEKTDNICEIFQEEPEWYGEAAQARDRWGVSISLLMAIIHQESLFCADARPPRTTCLWILPGPRPSSAYGYPQAGDAAWNDYREWTGRGGADRDDFADAVDFVGWYCHMSHIRCGIAKTDAYNLYLAYHEGHAGYNSGTYAHKSWLKNVAAKVKRRTDLYAGQLVGCEEALRPKPGCCLWPF